MPRYQIVYETLINVDDYLEENMMNTLNIQKQNMVTFYYMIQQYFLFDIYIYIYIIIYKT